MCQTCFSLYTFEDKANRQFNNDAKVLATSPIQHWLIYNKYGAGTICPVCNKAWTHALYFYLLAVIID